MAESNIEKVSGKYHVFLTTRFDQQHQDRIHFVGAITMNGNNEDTLKENPRILDIAEFIQFT